MIQITKMAGARTRHRGDGSPKKSLKRWLFRLSAILLIIAGSTNANGHALIYTGSTPSTGETIESLDEILLNFDFTNVIASYGENENWGVSYAGYEGDTDYPEQSVRIYKGDPESGELLVIGYTDLCKPNNSAFETENSFKLSFPDIQIEAGEQYTLVITDSFFAGIKGDKKYKNDTELNYADSPIELIFYGASETKKNLFSE